MIAYIGLEGVQHHTINAAHDNSPIFIYDADFGPICSPPHVPHNTLVPVSSTAGPLVTRCQSHVHFATCQSCQMTCTTTAMLAHAVFVTCV